MSGSLRETAAPDGAQRCGACGHAAHMPDTCSAHRYAPYPAEGEYPCECGVEAKPRPQHEGGPQAGEAREENAVVAARALGYSLDRAPSHPLAIYPHGQDEDGHCLRCGEWEEEGVTHECPPAFQEHPPAPAPPDALRALVDTRAPHATPSLTVGGRTYHFGFVNHTRRWYTGHHAFREAVSDEVSALLAAVERLQSDLSASRERMASYQREVQEYVRRLDESDAERHEVTQRLERERDNWKRRYSIAIDEWLVEANDLTERLRVAERERDEAKRDLLGAAQSAVRLREALSETQERLRAAEAERDEARKRECQCGPFWAEVARDPQGFPITHDDWRRLQRYAARSARAFMAANRAKRALRSRQRRGIECEPVASPTAAPDGTP